MAHRLDRAGERIPAAVALPRTRRSIGTTPQNGLIASHRPIAPRLAGMLLAPGAGAGRDHPALLALDRALSARGVAVERVDFPYRLAGRRRPDPPAVLARTIHEHATELAARIGVGTGSLALGGRSMGGRICSEVVAGGLPAAGLILVSYPLHPPGSPDRSRTGHFPALRVPCLFVSGTRDAFGTPGEIASAARLIPGPVTHAWIEGGDHGLRGRDAEVADVVVEWLAALDALSQPPRGAR